jgi:hypothetical protein
MFIKERPSLHTSENQMQDDERTTEGREVPSPDTLLEPDPRLNRINGNGDDASIDLAPYIYPVASFLIPIIVYWRTMCQALYIGDAGDFITASYTLGIPHPPGYPLYTLLGKLFLMLPIPGGLSQAAWRMNFMSAFFGALTILLIYFFILKVTKHNWLAFFAALSVAFAQTFTGCDHRGLHAQHVFHHAAAEPSSSQE